jgi:hypothetical protein
MGKIWTKIGHNRAEFSVFFLVFFDGIKCEKEQKNTSIPSPFAKSASKERAIHQLRDLRLEFVSKFPFDLSFVTFSIPVLLVLRKLPSREVCSCILKSKA